MPPFDIVTIGVHFFTLVVSGMLFYGLLFFIAIQAYSHIKKFRSKKLSNNSANLNFVNKGLSKSVTKLRFFCKKFLGRF